MSTTAVAAAAAGAVGVAAYLNAKFSIGMDLEQLRKDRSFTRRLNILIQKLGDRMTLYHMLELADQTNDALWFEGRTWTYAQAKAEADRVACILNSEGVQTGDRVAVLMNNSPEMVFTIYGIHKIGASPALINAALRDDTLRHCIGLAGAKLAVCSPELKDFAKTAVEGSTPPTKCISLDEFPLSASLYTEHVEQPKRSPADVAALIYTSGTTGKPKACAIKNMRLCLTGTGATADVDNPKKYYPLRTFSSMPLFHGTCFFTGLVMSVATSGCFCLAKKFSASKHWQMIHDSRATRMLYVGELCRYLVATPPGPYDKDHQCIVATGNGLQKDIWEEFKTRFGVPEIREYYRSTEGVAMFDNDGEGLAMAGMIGFSGPLRRMLADDTLIVKYDYDTQMPWRDLKTGFCKRVSPGEEGEAIGRIRSMVSYTNYLGNPEATNAKIMKDVFKKGDLFQRSGDLVVQDAAGWVRFGDRIGDTYRWKGENVSAGEISGYLGELDNVHDNVVFAQKLTKYDGQAGAAGVVLKSRSVASEQEFMSTLYKKLRAKGVPTYAVPRFIRVMDEISTGASFKRATNLVKAKSWDPAVERGTETLYWLDGSTYKPLDNASWIGIQSGSAKL